MRFADPLRRGRLIKRYKRFLADVRFDDGAEVTAHCPNPGSMLSVSDPGSAVWLSRSDNPKRKLAHTLEIIETPGGLVGVNPNRANDLVREAIADGQIAALAGYGAIRREVRYGTNSRIDLLLEDDDRPDCYVEVKSVTMRRDEDPVGLAEFPDAVTKRGAKHLAELSDMAAKGARAVMLFLAQRGDCGRFAVAADIDPGYAAAFGQAAAAGVEMLAFRCAISPEGIAVTDAIEIAL
ncbi:MAG TPA: DNA/RNA nuclease SfsA [Alphaproteobacteria bacterium]|nr:DNA/RNA nuclease SfsA [Alphaproteobacteria bacterium]